MPKKFKGENTKATSAKERKAEKLKEERLQKEKAIEDASWAETDKGILKKNQRKEEKEKKQQEALQKKEELKRLEMEESLNLSKATTPQSATKVTQFNIRKQTEEERRQAAAAANDKSSKLAAPLQLSENTNALAEEVSISGLDAVTSATLDRLTEGISATSVSPAQTPGRVNMAAEFAKFSEQMMPQVKKEFPGAKLSTLKDKVRKLWQRSPQNPLNQR